jgi:hypothetical protein
MQVNQTPTAAEREIAAETARQAMISGWTKAIQDISSQHGITVLAVEGILNRVSKDNPNRDPSARIDELSSWDQQSRIGGSEVKRNSLHRLSPGLRAYMERKIRSPR